MPSKMAHRLEHRFHFQWTFTGPWLRSDILSLLRKSQEGTGDVHESENFYDNTLSDTDTPMGVVPLAQELFRGNNLYDRPHALGS